MPGKIGHAEPATAASDEPGQRECLRCYLGRMLRAHGCDNTKRWTGRWRERCVPRDKQLIRRIEDRGGLCCDCEVVFNVWEYALDAGEQAAERPSGCAGTDSQDPLVPCGRWSGCSVSDPVDPFGVDDVDDVDDVEDCW